MPRQDAQQFHAGVTGAANNAGLDHDLLLKFDN
jgi:hypothetical protein